MTLHRRRFLQQSVATVATATLVSHTQQRSTAADALKETLIVDTHQHLWDLDQLKLPWLTGAPEILKKNYRPQEYREATQGLNVKAVYMEVDVDTAHHDKEADYVVGLCRSAEQPTRAAVIGGRPASADFEKYLLRHKASGFVKGVRQVLHGEPTPAGFCLKEEFVRGVKALGKHGLSFDLCMRPTELKDALKLTELASDTRFIVDHLGNADPKAFDSKLAPDLERKHKADDWKRDIAALAQRPNVICKISGIVASAPPGWRPEHLAPAINHCLDSFGPDRVIFGGDWPVCLLGAKFREWVEALTTIIASRPEDQRKKLWSENAVRWYGLKL